MKRTSITLSALAAAIAIPAGLALAGGGITGGGIVIEPLGPPAPPPYWYLFSRYDDNNDGFIDAEEALEMMRDLHGVIDPYDMAECTMEELIAWLRDVIGVDDPEGVAEDIMDEYDNDPKDGKLSLAEWFEFMWKNCLPRYTPVPSPVPVPE